MDCNAKPLVSKAPRSCIPAFSGLSVDRGRPRWQIATAQNIRACIDWSVGLSTVQTSESAQSGMLAFPSVFIAHALGSSADHGLTDYPLSGTRPECTAYLVLPTRGRYPASASASLQGLPIDWTLVGQVIAADRLNEPNADMAYTGLISELLAPLIPEAESALRMAHWCEPDALKTAVTAQAYARIQLDTAEHIGANLVLYVPESDIEPVLHAWRLSRGYAHQLADTLQWLEPIALSVSLPCAHMSTVDLHRVRSGYVIRLGMTQRHGDQIVVSGFASGGDVQRQAGWSAVAWNIHLHWEQAQAGDHFSITWSHPMQDVDDMPYAPGSPGWPAGLNASHLPAPTPEPLPLPDSRITVTLECVLGTQSYRLEDLMQIRPGELLSFTEWQWPTVSLRLSGKTLGVGELVLCGDELAIQVTQWHPSEGSDEQPV